MLVINDINLNTEKKENNTIEIVYYNDSQLNYIKNVFNIKSKPTFKNPYITGYKLKNKGKLILHDADCNKTLKELLEQSFGHRMNFKQSSPLVTFILESARVFKLHRDFYTWERRVKNYLYNKRNYIDDGIDNNIQMDISRKISSLATWSFYQDGLYNSSYNYSQYNKYTFIELLKVSTNCSHLIDSPLYKMTYVADGFLLQTQWARLSFQEKIDAVVERLYIDTLREYLIPYMEDFKTSPNESQIFANYKRAIMHMACQTTDQWFYRFAVENYYIITKKFNLNFKKRFISALKTGVINPI